MDTSTMVNRSGRKIRVKDMPEDLSAVSSSCSAKLPRVMMLLIKMAKGRARFTNLAEAYRRSSSTTWIAKPFPISSSA